MQLLLPVQDPEAIEPTSVRRLCLNLIGVPMLLAGALGVAAGWALWHRESVRLPAKQMMGLPIAIWGVASLILGWRLLRHWRRPLGAYNSVWALATAAPSIVWFVLAPGDQFLPTNVVLIGALVSALIALLGRSPS